MAQSPFAHSPQAADALREAKRVLRESVLAARDRMPAGARAAASAAIVTALAGRADFAAARTVLLTLPFGSEWDSLPLLLMALERGKTVVMPRVDTATRTLELCRLTEPGRDVLPGYRGIPEPLSHCALITADAIDWVLVPGVAFDAAGWRLGYGGGYYDRLLPTLRSDISRIAGAYDLQLLDRVPAAPHDVPVHALVTETRMLQMPH
ncbi:MAG: 5-formyltetrahydrofolate cyclo-ligase [Betaproteobacteria bacterium]